MIRILLAALFLPCFAGATDIYLAASPTGNDGTGNGTTGAPYATIAKLNTLGVTTGDRVYFRKGDTFDGQLTFSGNGSAGSKILFGSWGAGTVEPILNGFQSIVSWSNLGSNIWEASVNSGLNLNLVLVNGVPTAQGRTPDAGSYYRVILRGGISDPDYDGFITSSSVNSAVKNWTGAEMVLRATEYNKDRNLVTSHSGTTINYTSQSAHNSDTNAAFFFQHDVSTLNLQNEWYYNSTAHTLRMYSTTNPSSIGTGVKAAVYDVALNRDPINYVEFDGLKFSGYDSIALRLRFANHIKVMNCKFDMIGCNGLFFDTGLRDSVINCTFTNIMNTAIWFAYCDDPLANNNTINGCGLYEGLAQGNNQQMDGILFVNTADSAVAMFNDIRNVGYCGITFDGNNSIIQNNVVDSFGLSISDGGGIYSCCNNVGNTSGIGTRLVNGNIVTNGFGKHNDAPSPFDGGMPAIYLDDNTGNVNITGNTIRRSTRSGIFLHNTDNIGMTGNKVFLIGTTQGIGLEDDDLGGPQRSTNIQNNEVYVQPGVSLMQLRSDANDYGSMGTFNNNFYGRSGAGNLFNVIGNVTAGYSLATWRSTYSFDALSTFTPVVDDSMAIFINSFAYDFPSYFVGNSYKTFGNTTYSDNVSVPSYGSVMARRVSYVSPVVYSTYDYIINNAGRKKKQLKVP